MQTNTDKLANQVTAATKDVSSERDPPAGPVQQPDSPDIDLPLSLPACFPDNEWHSAQLFVTLNKTKHPVEYHIHYATGITWAFLKYECDRPAPSGYWFRILDWANTTGCSHETLITDLPREDPFVIGHWAFERAYLMHVGIPDKFGRQNPSAAEIDVLDKDLMTRLGELAAQYGEFEKRYPDTACPNVPVLTVAQRIFMIEYSLVRVFDWIEHLWRKYPTEAPAIALAHTVGLRPRERNEYLHGFMERLERIACMCLVESKMAPPSKWNKVTWVAHVGNKDPKMFQDGGRFQLRFNPAVVKRSVHPAAPVGKGPWVEAQHVQWF
ncbi:hypothetical protein GGF31_004306 [Allomyces arbusculus]|nr:hypothetical protein GGF31_004306 [Allomyces arbusculus]